MTPSPASGRPWLKALVEQGFHARQALLARFPGLVLRGGRFRNTAEEHVALNLTTRCNQRCVFCFEGERDPETEPSTEQARQILAQAASHQRAVILMGAEALLRKDILDLLAFGSELGLAIKVFTNGTPLARKGFVGQLAEAGLAGLSVSFHYANADDFSAGTGVARRFFDRLLRGLEDLATHNEQRPGQYLPVQAETVLMRFNSGKLGEMQRLLKRHLGASYTGQTYKSLSPSPRPRLRESLLEPLRSRREELTDLLGDLPAGLLVNFSMVPLCLLPGNEHRSLDVIYKGLRYEVLANFEDRAEMSVQHPYDLFFRRNPFRSICQDCKLLPICPTVRTNWNCPITPPTPDQRPIPDLDQDPEQVLKRALGTLGYFRHKAREWTGRRPKAGPAPVPEWRMMQAIRAAADPASTVGQIRVGPEPWLRVPIGPDSLSVHRPAAGDESTRALVVKNLCFRWREPRGAPTAAHGAFLRRLARHAFPPSGDWSDMPGSGEEQTMDTAASAWHLFEDRLWPGLGRFGHWRTRAIRFERSSLSLQVRRRDREAWIDFLRRPANEDDAAPAGHSLLIAGLDGQSIRLRTTGAASREAHADLWRALLRRASLAGWDISRAPRLPGVAPPPEPKGPDSPAPPPASETRDDTGDADRVLFEGSGFGRQADQLRIDILPEGGPEGRLVFFIGRADADSQIFASCGQLGLSYRPGPDDAVVRSYAAGPGAVMRQLRTPPNPQSGPRWAEALKRWSERAGLVAGHRWEVSQYRIAEDGSARFVRLLVWP